jgi:phage shock protein A
LRIASEQLEHVADDERDKEIRSLVSETPLAARELEEAQRHRLVMETHVHRLRQQITEMESLQDSLLDRMNERG